MSWTRRTFGAWSPLNDVTYGNGIFVAVGGSSSTGFSGPILTSPDGVSWTSQAGFGILYGVAYGNGIFVAIGDGGTILTSPDGVTWTIRTSGTSRSLYGAAYGNGIFVAVGANRTILTSPDGVSWTIRSSVTTYSLPGVAYGNSTFVAVGDGGSILTSPDGVTWTTRTSRTSLSGVTYGNGTFVAVGTNGAILQSDPVTSTTEIISTPSTPNGPASGAIGTSYTYTTGGSVSSLGHSVQYLFDWGDGTNSGWLPVGTTSASHSWTSVGTYTIKAQARCATDASVLSSWSSSISVTINPAAISDIVTTNPSGLQIVVDGSTYTAPQTFSWTPGSSHTLSVASPQSGASGTRYVYSSWSDGGAQTHTITAPSSTTTYTATFSTQYELTITSSPLGGGTVTSSPTGDQSGIACPTLVGVFCPGYYSSGTLVTLTATPNPGYTFSAWSGDLLGNVNPSSIIMNAPKTITANFTTMPPETVSTPNVPTGPLSGTVGISLTYTVSGSTSSLGHSVEYQFDWKGDGSDLSSWGSSTQSKIWTVAGTYHVRARARCSVDTSVISGWSGSIQVVIASSFLSLVDFDGDRKTDITIWRPGNGYWFIIHSSDGTVTYTQWGTERDIPVPGDYDGDGKTDITIWRPGNGYWFIIHSSDGTVSYTQWGEGYLNDIPVAGDYDGDGKTDIAVWRPGNGCWYVIKSSDGSKTCTPWGAPNDIPVPGDYDGDGKTDIAVWRPENGYWYIIRSSDGNITYTQWGGPNDMPVPGDYDGDGKTDIAVWRESDGYWYIIRSSDGMKLYLSPIPTLQ